LKNRAKYSRIHDAQSFWALLSQAKHYVTSDLLAKGLVFLSIPIVTRLLTTEDYGVLSVYISITSNLIIIFGLGLRGSITRYYYEDTADFNRFLGAILTYLFLFDTFLVVVLIIFKIEVAELLQINPEWLIWVLLISVVTVIYEIYLSVLQASKRSKEYSILSFIKSSCTLFVAILLMWKLDESRYLGQVYSEATVVTSVAIYSLVQLARWAKINVDWKYLKYALVFAIPVLFHLLSQTILSSFDQIIINQLVGRKETGLYSFAYQIGLIQSVIVAGMLRAWTPIFYESMKLKTFANIEGLAIKYTAVICATALALMLFSYEIMFLLADEKFHSANTMVPPIVLSYVFFSLYTVYVGYAFYHKRTLLVALSTIVSAGINIILNYTLIPIFGYEIASYTTLISFIILGTLHYINVRFVMKEIYFIPISKLLPNIFWISIIYGVVEIIKLIIVNYTLLFMTKIVFMFLFLFYVRRNLGIRE